MNGVLVDREALAELQQRFATKPTTRWIGLQLTRDEAQLVERALSALALPAQAAADAAEAWPLGAQVLYTGPRPELSRTAPWTVIESQHAHLTRITRDGIETGVPHDCLRAPTVSAKLHRLAVEATATDSPSSAVRHARDELVRVCLSLGGDAAPVETPADEGTDIPPEIVEIVTLIGPAQWSRTPAYTPEEHGEGMARSVRLTAEHFNQGDEPQHMQMLVREGTDIVIGYTGTSPHSAQITRALAGAWNHLHQLCVQKAGGES